MFPWSGESKLKVAVVGDIILDEYLTGTVNRVSPEAPIPVLKANAKKLNLGGAANTAHNIQNLGGNAYLFGITGNDLELKNLLVNSKINYDGVVFDKNKTPIRKTRIVAGNQQIVRVDWEKPMALSKQEELIIFNLIEKIKFDLMVISDYGKGLLSTNLLNELYDLAKIRNIKTITDPKGSDFQKYNKSTFLTPNIKEAKQALSIDEEQII